MNLISETEETELVRLALEARKLAYAPYSGYTVGAALLAVDGHRYLGGNITAIAIAGGTAGEEPVEYAYPCGICRQVMQEFCTDDFVIYVVKNEQDYQSYTLKELLPYGFGGDAIR